MTTLFVDLAERAAELDSLGQAYLDSLPFVSNEEICERVWKRANEVFAAAGEDWEAVPEWVANTMDGYIPYSQIPRNGSLHFSLGFSVVSLEAHLRNLLEIAEGRTSVELDFPVLAEMPE